MNAHTQISDAQLGKVFSAKTRADADRLTISEKVSHWPDREKVKLIRILAGELSWSHGADYLDRGCDWIERDLNDEDSALHGKAVLS